MPARHVNIILMTACLSVLCYVVQRRTKTAMLVGDAIAMIDAYYVDPVDRDELILSAMNGMTQSLDEHSEFIAEQNYQAFQDTIQQEFAGIGIYVEQPEPEEPVRVVTPLVGSPALTAGILPGDRILRVEEEDVSSMSLPEVSKRLKGPVGTEILIGVKRGQEEIDLVVQRARIEIDSVIGDYRDDKNRWVYRVQGEPDIAYLRLTSFGDRTTEELTAAFNSLQNDYQSLILDLRGNGGGLLRTAVDVSNMFLSEGRIVSTRTRGGKIEDQFDATTGTLIRESKPMAVLIDQDSASASEIVAACLQDHERAIIVGKRSFGKGTVQNILPLQYGRSALRLTVAKYYRPNGENIHRKRDATDEDQWGVTPDSGFDVDLEESNLERLAKRWREASYPSLASISDDRTPALSSETTEEQAGAANIQDVELSSNKNESNDRLDTQLWAAVEALKTTKKMEPQSPK